MKIIIKCLIPLFLLFPLSSNAQVSKKIILDINVSIIGDRAKVFEDQLKSYLHNELLKIPDIKITEDNPDYTFFIRIFQLPCKCDWFDFHYRAHFLNNHQLFEDSYISISEGFEGYDDIEELAKILIANLNADYFSALRN